MLGRNGNRQKGSCMSPLEIPGSVLKLLTRVGKKKCGHCKQYYSASKLRQAGDVIYKICPLCNHVIAKYSKKTLLRRAGKLGK